MSAAQSEGLNIGYYLTLVSRRRWFIIVPFCLAMIVGMVLAVKLPKIYEATTLILVQPQRVPEKMVASVVDSDIENRISTLSQQIMSRSNLERVIDQFKLFSDPDSANMLMEDKLESLRKRIKVEVGRVHQGEEGRGLVFHHLPGPRPANHHAGGQRAGHVFHRRKPQVARGHCRRHQRLFGLRARVHAQAPGGTGAAAEEIPRKEHGRAARAARLQSQDPG